MKKNDKKNLIIYKDEIKVNSLQLNSNYILTN